MRDNKGLTATALIIWIIWGWATPYGLSAGPENGPGEQRLSRIPELKIKVWVDPGGPVVKTQQVQFVVELSTSTWFAGGTRVKPLELAEAVVLEAGQLAVNFTRDEEGGPWSVQQWTFFIYPLKNKTYTIPEIRVTAFVADGRGGQPRTLEAMTRPLRFTALIPAKLENREDWVAASGLTIQEQYSSLSEVYTAGDAVERRIDFETDGLPAMMLPAVREHAVPGLAVYPEPPIISDAVNRGQIIGRRTERIVYVVEKPGTYRIPERHYTWYNIHTRQLETVSLREKIISTRAHGQSLPGTDGDLAEKFEFLRYALWIVAPWILTGFAVVIYRCQKGKSGPSAPALKRALKKALKNRNREEATRILYRWFDHWGPPGKDYTHWRQFLRSTRGPEALQCFDGFMALAYGPDSSRKPATKLPAKKIAALMGRRSFTTRFWKKKPLPDFRLSKSTGFESEPSKNAGRKIRVKLMTPLSFF